MTNQRDAAMTTMNKIEELEALAERCEREKPSLALSFAIFRAVSKRPDDVQPDYTASLDAAVTLVPGSDDVFWRLGHDGEGPDPSVFRAEILVCSANIPGSVARSGTSALALCAAALKARAALLKENRHG